MSFIFGTLLADILCLVGTFVVVTYTYFRWTFQHWKRRNIPYLEPTIPFGNMQSPLSATTSSAEISAQLYKKAKAQGWRHCGIFNMINPTYMPIDLDLLKHVLTEDFSNFVDRALYSNERDDPLGCHIFSLHGTKWRNLRTKLTPAFTSVKLKAMFSTLAECGLLLEEYLEQQLAYKKAVDIKYVSGCFSTDIIGSCAFGLSCNSFKDPNSPFRVYGNKIVLRDKLGNVKIAFGSNFPNLARALRISITPKDVTEFFTKVVEDTVAYREKNNVARKDFLQLLIDIKNSGGENGKERDGKTVTMTGIVAQCFIFFFAGFDTTSTTMSFALYELATHRDIQDKVREETATVLAKHDSQITYDSLSELKYTEQVIDETLRKYPPGPVMTRVCTKDWKVPGVDAVLTKGSCVHIPIYAIHHDEEYYKDPTVFDPDRFSEENKSGRHPYAHIPFGAGPRICIGERFAVMQTKVGLTSLLKKFKFTVNAKTRVPLKISATSIFLAAEGGIWLDIENV